MRAGPLSNTKVVSLLNRYFVPVYAVNEDYRKGGSAPAAEKAEYLRIYHAALKAKLSTGTVHVYILDSKARPIDSLHVATAAKVDRLLDLLERTIKKLGTPEGKPLVKPSPQSAAPRKEATDLVLHVTARYLVRDGKDLVPLGKKANLGETRHASWWALPSENWVVLKAADWARLLPAGEVRPRSSWSLDKKVGARVLTYFYPQTENNDTAKNRIDEQELKATVLSVKGGVVRARIDGRLKMKHPFYHKDDSKVVEATVVGLIEFEQRKNKVRSLQLATDQATYGPAHFGVAVRLVP
jgi:hypothetical protein